MVFLSLLLSLLYSKTLFSQILSDFDLITLDNFLLNDKFTNVNNFFTEKDSILKEFKIKQSEMDEYFKIKNRYQNTLLYFSKLDSFPAVMMDEHINQFKTLEGAYSKDKVGEESANYYVKFIVEAEKGNKIQSLKYYRLAQNRKYFMNLMKQKTITTGIEKIKIFLDQNDYINANIVLNSVELETKNNFFNKEILSEILSLKKLIDNKLKEIEAKNRFFRQTELLNSKNSISIGALALPYATPVTENQKWIFESTYNDARYYLLIDEINNFSGYGVTIDYSRYLYHKVKFEITYGYGKINAFYKNSVGFSSDFSISLQSAKLLLNYIFRKELGIRPYSGFGYQHLFLTREEIGYNRNLFSWQDAISKEMVSDISQLVFQLGLEYVSDSMEKYLFQVYITGHYNLSSSKHIGSFNYFAGVKIGYLF